MYQLLGIGSVDVAFPVVKQKRTVAISLFYPLLVLFKRLLTYVCADASQMHKRIWKREA